MNFPFFKSNQPLWLIEKLGRGEYLNSPPVWRDCGLIRAPSRERAAGRACFVVGSSQVRVSPAEDLAQ